jgi:flagellar hook assembly protein FlgD
MTLSQKGSFSLLQIVINTTGSPVTLTWDGTSNSSTNVTPGTYQIELHWNDGQGQASNIIRTVQVVSVGGVSGTVVAEPNVLISGSTVTTFNGSGVANAWTLNVKIYTIAGELITSITGAPGTTTVPWNASGMASGIYIAAVQVQDVNGGVLANQLLKVLVLH